MRWLWSLLIWFLLTTTAIAASGLAADGDQGKDMLTTAPSFPGDRAVYKSALVVVEGGEAQWFDLNARYAFERVPDRVVLDQDGTPVVTRSFVHEWAAEPFEFALTDYLFLDFPTCFEDLSGMSMEDMMSGDPNGQNWESFSGMDENDWETWEAEMDACGDEIEVWGEGAQERFGPYVDNLDAWGEDTHTVQASAWHVSHVGAAGSVVASTLRGKDTMFSGLMPDLPQQTAWTIPEATEAPCGFDHSFQTGASIWAPATVYGACPPTMDFGFASTQPLAGPVTLLVSGEDTVGDWDTTVFAHETEPDLLRLWVTEEVPYPVRILSEVSVVPPEWLPYANNGHPPQFFILQELIEHAAGADAPSPDAPVLPPVYGSRAPWGPSDAGVAHPWPLSHAYLQTSRLPDSQLGDWLIDHPNAAVDSAAYIDPETWSFTLTEGTSGLLVRTQRADGHIDASYVETVTNRPDATEQPDEMASVRSLAQRHNALGGETTAWSFSAFCGGNCDEPTIRITVGQQPDWGDDHTHLTVFDQNGRAQAQAEDPSPYPDPKFADDAWNPSEASDGWGFQYASAGGIWTWPEPKTAAGVAAATGLLSLLYFLWPLVKGAGALPLFSRIKSADLLEHPVRSDLYDVITDTPGIHFQEVVRRIEKGRGTTEHHIRKLVTAGLLVEKADRGFTCYFPKGAMDRRLMDAAPAMKAPGARQVLQAIHAQPGTVAADLSDRLGMPTSTVNYHLKKLVGSGLVDTTRQGRYLALQATGLGDQALGTFHT